MLYKSEKRKSKTYNDDYNEEVQKVLLSMLLSDPEGFAICRTIIQEEYFDDRLRPAIRYILQYTDEEQKLPAVEQVKAKSGIQVEKFSEGDQHRSSMLKEIEAFCKYKAMELAVLDGVELLQTGRAGEIVERVKDALTISLISELGTDYYLDPGERLHRMKDKSGYVSTGWKTLDDKLYGGFSVGSLNIFAAISGAGKSLFLQNLAVNWSFQGHNVLYISLELSEELVSLRLDAMITGRGTSEVLREVDETVIIIRNKERTLKPGKIFVKRLPEAGTTINTIRAYYKEFRIKTGLEPNVILIDYLDLMYPTNVKIDVGDHFVKDKFVSEEIRAFMHETKMFGATASQLNRSSHDASEYDHSHIAGGISKINTADNVFGIQSTIAMKEKGIIKLQFLKTRTSSANGQIIELAYDPVSMRITDLEVSEEVDKTMSKADSRKAANATVSATVDSSLSRLRKKIRDS